MRCVAVIAFAIVVIGAVVHPRPAAAVTGFDSAYAGESAFLSLAPGKQGTFSVFFVNTGAQAWVKGTTTQVDLAACLDDKTTCDRQDPAEARFDPGTWAGTTRYATQSQQSVSNGQIGTFSYDVKVPADQMPGTLRFNGDLVVRALGVPIHPEGYFHELTVVSPGCTVGSIAVDPVFQQRQVGMTQTATATVTCAGSTAGAANVSVTFTIVPAAADAGNDQRILTATTDAAGKASVSWSRLNPGTDTVTAYPTSAVTIRALGMVRWTIALRVFECTPTDPVTQNNGTTRTLTATVYEPATGQRWASKTFNVTVRTFIETGTATINGSSAVRVNVGATVVQAITNAEGTAQLVLSGFDATIEPRVFLDERVNSILDADEFRADCASTKFAPSNIGTP